jgi:probable HAF family extracellular repeat protein
VGCAAVANPHNCLSPTTAPADAAGDGLPYLAIATVVTSHSKRSGRRHSDYSFAMDINSKGQITGWSELGHTGTRNRTFIFESGIMKNLGALSPKPNRALGINEWGEIVGSSADPANPLVQSATLWTRE